MSNQAIGDDRDQEVRAWLTEIGGVFNSRTDCWWWPLECGNRLEWQRGAVTVGHPRFSALRLANGIDTRKQLLDLLAALPIDATEAGRRRAG